MASYVILQRERKHAGNPEKWQVATSVIRNGEHSAAQRQKNIERADPTIETCRVAVELP